ncbi:hypothetical protein EDB83DRAFT_2434172 [Lactarius deliciosus]|nr:hypothetical protein EDB83DRAFT_2434172 [Lactarius deliciosus]
MGPHVTIFSCWFITTLASPRSPQVANPSRLMDVYTPGVPSGPVNEWHRYMDEPTNISRITIMTGGSPRSLRYS